MKSNLCTGILCCCLLTVTVTSGIAKGKVPVRKAALTQATRVLVVDKPDVAQSNSYYDGNRAPLLPSPLIKLPFGAIKPQGWLRKQLELEADGFVGHLTELSPFCNKNGNAWLNPDGIGGAHWEEVPYWIRGYAALGYVLDDKTIIKEAQQWIDTAIASQTDFGYFGTRANLFAPTLPAIPADLLTTPDGKPGLLGEYYEDPQFKTLKTTRVDSLIDFDWKGKSPLEGIGGNDFSVRWTGNITVKKTGDYTLSTYSDDGARLWVDGKQIIDNWRIGVAVGIPADKPVHLEANKPYPIKLEYYQAGGGSEIRLGWKMPGATYECRTNGPDFMPNMSLMYALRANYEYTGDKRIIDLLTKYFHWQLTVPDNKFFAGGWQTPRNGDNMDSVYWLYNITGDPKLLELCDKLMRTGVRWMGKVNGGHNVDYSQGFRKPAQYYMQAKDPKYLQATENNYNDMYSVWGQVPGGMFGGDEFARHGHTDPQQAIETCGTVDMMLSQETLLNITGDLKWADRCEDITFNTLPASFTADMKALRYLTSPNQSNSDKRSKYPVLADAGTMQWMNPYEHRCCQHNGGMGWPYFAQNLWHATPDNGVAAIMYAPSQVNVKVGDGAQVSITETTQYPFDGKVVFTIKAAKPAKFPLYLRVPNWCSSPAFKINKKAIKVASKPSSLVMIDRKWVDGDKVTVDFPMDIKIRTWEKNKDSISVDRGPLTYSVKIAENYVRSGGTDKWPAWEIKPGTPWNYGLVIDKNNPAKSFEVVKKPWPKDGQPFAWNNAPIELKVKAKKIPNWQENIWGTVDLLQPSPVKSSEPVETISMIPMGAGRLRISSLPLIGNGPDAREWKPQEEPIASATNDWSPLSAMTDGIVPAKSSQKQNRQYPAFTWWPEAGGVEYVIQKFGSARTVSTSEVFWFSDEDATTVPESWTLYYRDGKEWKPVTNPSKFGLERDKFNKVTFDPVKTTEMKLETKLGGRSGGIFEWRIN